MAQTTDIQLNSAGYMIEPGSPQSPGYKRLQDGHLEGLTQRTTLTDFFGGQQRALQLERDTFYTSTNIKPTLGGQGVAPWVRMGLLGGNRNNASITTPIPHVIVKDKIYFAIGDTLYSGPHTTTGGADAVPTGLKTYPNIITDITIYASGGLLIAFGSAADIIFRAANGTESTFIPGDRAHKIEAYAGYAMWIDARPASSPTVIRMNVGGGFGADWRHVNYDATHILTADGKIMIVTKQALYTMDGRVVDTMIPNPAYDPDNPTTKGPTMPSQKWTGDFKPFYQQGVYNTETDFTFITSYGGRTIAWLAGGVHELVPSGDRAGWRSTGLTGRRCFGGTVCQGYVIVSIESLSGLNELWGYDGNGWWRIDHQPMPVGTTDGIWCWPMDVGSEPAFEYNLFVFVSGDDLIRRYRLTPTAANNTINDTAEFVTPMIDAGDRDKIKAWRKIGAVFASPELRGNLTSTDAIIVALDYSTDAGETWVLGSSAAGTDLTLTSNTLANMNFAMQAALSGITSRFIMLRVRWRGLADWAPILAGVWVEHEALSSPARRRKWQLRIHARDQEIDRDGIVLTRTGRELIEDLWQAWENDQPLTFRDIDYDTDPTERTVRIVGISEHVAHPFDSADWGDSTITLNLVEV